MKEVRISIDGSWQKRGHNSLNGVVTAVCSDKCIDAEIFTKHCNGFKMWRSKKELQSINIGWLITSVNRITRVHQVVWNLLELWLCLRDLYKKIS